MKLTEWVWADDASVATAKFACGTDASTESDATPVLEKQLAATCTEAGYRIYTASVTDDDGVVYTTTKTYEDDALGHSITKVEAAAPACGSGNIEYWYCGICHKNFSDEAGTTEITSVKAEHKYEEVVTAPTCTKFGYTTHTCSVCGDSYTDTYVEATGHTYSTDPDWNVYDHSNVTATFTCDEGDNTLIVKADKIESETKTDEGKIYYTASVTVNGKTCKKVFSENIDDHKHQYSIDADSWIWTPADDTYTVSVTFKCTCNETITENASKVTLDSDVAATCESDGLKMYVAEVSYNGSTYTATKKIVVTKTNHANVQAIDAKAATCTESGNIAYLYCPDCGKYLVEKTSDSTEKQYEEISRDAIYTQALGHELSAENISWAWSENNRQATATVSCTRCSEKVAVAAVVNTAESDNKVTYTATITLNDKTYSDQRVEETEEAKAAEAKAEEDSKLAQSKEEAINALKAYAAENNISLDDPSVAEGIQTIKNAQNADEISTNLNEAKSEVDTAEPATPARTGASVGEMVAVIGGGAMIIVCALLVIVLISRRKKNL
jgi:hypothetical protein